MRIIDLRRHHAGRIRQAARLLYEGFREHWPDAWPSIAAATAAPRMHHQWYPDVLGLEKGYSPDTLRLLEAKGHTLREGSFTIGSLQSAGYRNGVFRGASDTRRPSAGSVAAEPAE